MDVHRVWLKLQTLWRWRRIRLSLDIGAGFQIFRRRFTEILGARQDQGRGKSYSGLEKGNRHMNFSAKELYALIHNLKQHLWAIRRVDRSGMRTKQHSPAFKFEFVWNEQVDQCNEYRTRLKTLKPLIVVLSHWRHWIAISHEIAIQPNPGQSFPHWLAPMEPAFASPTSVSHRTISLCSILVIAKVGA
jgi:hypothetical protein